MVEFLTDLEADELIHGRLILRLEKAFQNVTVGICST